MKKSLLIISALALGANSFAQLDAIPAANFDAWTTTGSDTEPNHWGTLNGKSFTVMFGGNPVAVTMPPNTVTQATGADVFGANTISINTTSFGGQAVPGLAASNTSSITVTGATTPPKFYGGFPFRQRPVALTGKCKYTPGAAGDSAGVVILLTKWIPLKAAVGTTPAVPAHRDTIGAGVAQLINATWSKFSDPIMYKPGANAPDTALIILSSSGTSPKIGSHFLVDSLGFDYGCVLDSAIVTTGTAPAQLPSTADTLKLTAGTNFTKTWTIFIPKNVTSPVPADLDSVKISPAQVVAVGLGSSSTYTVTSNWPNYMFGSNTVGCITVSGKVPATPVDGNGSVTITPKVFGPGVLASFPNGFDAPAQKTIVRIGKGLHIGIATFDQNGFDVSQNNPNPFDGSTVVNFTCPVSGKVSFVVVDVLGRQVYNTTIGANAGANTFTFSTDLSSGTYFFSVSDGTNVVTKKMVVTGN